MDGKMSKRELSETEKRICNKMIVKFEKEVGHLKFLERYYDLMISEGLMWNYMEKIEQEKQKRKEILQDMQEAILKIVELKRQILEGVEEKPSPVGMG